MRKFVKTKELHGWNGLKTLEYVGIMAFKQWLKSICYLPELLCRNPNAFSRLFKLVSFRAFTTFFPDNALRPELAVPARGCTGFTVFKTFKAVPDAHLLTFNITFAFRMIFTGHFSASLINTRK